MQAEASSESKKVAVRTLVITTMFSIFISLVVFVVASYFFLIPLITAQQIQIQAISQRLSAVEGKASATAEAVAQAPAPMAANAVVHASAPAPAPGTPVAVPAKAEAPAAHAK